MNNVIDLNQNIILPQRFVFPYNGSIWKSKSMHGIIYAFVYKIFFVAVASHRLHLSISHQLGPGNSGRSGASLAISQCICDGKNVYMVKQRSQRAPYVPPHSIFCIAPIAACNPVDWIFSFLVTLTSYLFKSQNANDRCTRMRLII